MTPPDHPIDADAEQREWKVIVYQIAAQLKILPENLSPNPDSYGTEIRGHLNTLLALEEFAMNDNVKDRPTIERAVREQLVDVLKVNERCVCAYESDDPDYKCDWCTALAAAEKLEKEDAG